MLQNTHIIKFIEKLSFSKNVILLNLKGNTGHKVLLVDVYLKQFMSSHNSCY